MERDSVLNQPNAIQLKEKIQQKKACVGVVGLGYVGLPLAVEKGKVGFTVIGFDQNLKKLIRSIRAKIISRTSRMRN